MRTKEEILQDLGINDSVDQYGNFIDNDIQEAMDKWADEALKKYIKWCEPKGWLTDEEIELSLKHYKSLQ